MKADKFIKKIYNPRYHVVWTCAIGVNQSGKTDLNLFIMERLHALGLAAGFGSNIPIKAPFHVDFIEDWQTLVRHCMMLNPNPEKHGIKRYFFFWSEMGKSIAQDMPWENTKFVREMQLVRKFGLSVLGDGIDRIDKRIFSPSHFHGFFEKHSKERPHKAVYIDWTKKGMKTTIDNIPKTTLGYNTFYPAVFFWEAETPDGLNLPLNEDHKIVKTYRDTGSWKKAGVRTQEGKRSLFKVLDFHFTHCLREIAKETDSPEPIKLQNPKDSVEVTE